MSTEHLKVAHGLAEAAKEVFVNLTNLHLNEGGIPNTMAQDDNSVQFNVVMGEHIGNLHMNIHVYLANINSYMLESIFFFPQEDFIYPEMTPRENATFIITGSPELGATKYDKPIGALSLDEAVESAIEYLHDNIEDIIKETLGLVDN